MQHRKKTKLRKNHNRHRLRLETQNPPKGSLSRGYEGTRAHIKPPTNRTRNASAHVQQTAAISQAVAPKHHRAGQRVTSHPPDWPASFSSPREQKNKKPNATRWIRKQHHNNSSSRNQRSRRKRCLAPLPFSPWSNQATLPLININGMMMRRQEQNTPPPPGFSATTEQHTSFCIGYAPVALLNPTPTTTAHTRTAHVMRRRKSKHALFVAEPQPVSPVLRTRTKPRTTKYIWSM